MKNKAKRHIPVFTAASLLAIVAVCVCLPSAASNSDRKLTPIVVGCFKFLRQKQINTNKRTTSMEPTEKEYRAE